ncbi:MAG: hypothetical protein AM326_00380 [Candidatus Thorarchaeota archaeon SMTZ-45]|nr:MAG: hypothetical protein AM326_00380 [Candidatus Thorarchaeota archaeon SMTZ-45]
MVTQIRNGRVIRKAVRLRNYILEELGESIGQQSNLRTQQIIFLHILKEMDGNLKGFQRNQEYQKLGLFANSPGNSQGDPYSILTGKAGLFLDLDFGPRDDKSILDTRILFLGSVYEALKSQERRKHRGVYYTPYGLAQTICRLSLDSFESNECNSKASNLLGLRILDNACGSGIFLFAMLEELLKRIKTSARTVVLSNISVKTNRLDAIASYLLRHSLFGHDLDEDAINIAQAQLWLALYHLAGAAPSFIPGRNLRVADTLVSEESDDQYDIIIGNPPYMRLTSRDVKYKHAIKKRYSLTREYNTHALFIQASMAQLRKGGILGYLIHKNLLTLDTFSSFRQSLVATNDLIHLSDCGPGVFSGVTAETAIIVLQKGPTIDPSSVTLSVYDSKTGDCSVTAAIDHEPYFNLISPWNNRYLLSISPEIIPYLLHMSRLPLLNTEVTIKRGIETGSNRRFISNEPKSDGNWMPLLRGRDIAKYDVKSSVYLNYKPDELAKPGRRDLQHIPKVVVQQNSEHPIASFDSGRFLVLNSANYMFNASEEMLKTICVLLNSKLISWFFKTVMTNNAGLTVNLLPNNLGRIPIPSSPDLTLFSMLCDVLVHLKSASKSSLEESARFKIWHEILAETFVVEAYFPHLIKDKKVFNQLRIILNSLQSRSFDLGPFDEKIAVSAKRILKEFEFLNHK